jgi:hypothetical protein
VTDIRREHALFELLLADDAVLLDMGFSDEGVFEIALNNPQIGGIVVAWDDLQDWIERAGEWRKLIGTAVPIASNDGRTFPAKAGDPVEPRASV